MGRRQEPWPTLESTTEYRSFLEQFIVEMAFAQWSMQVAETGPFRAPLTGRGPVSGDSTSYPASSSETARKSKREVRTGDARRLDAYAGFDLLVLKDVLQHWSNENILCVPASTGAQVVSSRVLINCDDERAESTDIH